MNTIFQSYAIRAYRRDIQGIRAIGAIMIMVYHIWVHKVSGGVDVFFVVSGFFMGNVLLAQLAAENKIRPLVFWGKIINRVAPSAYMVLLATLLLAYLFIPETQWVNLVNEVLASAFHLENIHLMRSSVDYLARQEPPSAVQQFWALSIQMQFYFLLPFLLMAAATLAAKARSIYPLILIVLAVLGMSFIYSVFETANSPDSAYFNPATRLWEFFVGVAIAVLMPYIQMDARVRHALGWVGLVALVFGGLLIPKSIPFPGFVALIPVGAAALLIMSGTEHASTGANRLLCHRLFGFFGQISFTIYLWHWPLMVVYLEATGAQSVGVMPGVGIIAGSIVMAVLTSFLIERTFSKVKARGHNPLTPYLVGTAFFVPAVAIAGAIKVHFEAITSAPAAAHGFFGGSQITLQQGASNVSYRQFLAAKGDLPKSYQDSCHQRTANPRVIACEYGDTRATDVVALVGGSHATQWLPALDTIGRALNVKVVNISKSYCPLGALEGSHASCVEWNRRVIEYLAETQPQLVITNSTRAAKNGKAEHIPASYVQQWRTLADHGINVVGIRDNPQLPFDPVHCLVRNKENALACAIPRTQALLAESPAAAAAAPVDAMHTIDMTPYLCTKTTCPAVFDDILIYRDREHISVAYVDYLTTRLFEQLAQVAPNIFDASKAAIVTSQGAE